MVAAHSTFQKIVNDICMQVGLPTITDTDSFNSRTGLQRPHLQIIMYVDDADAKLTLRLSEIFTKRRFVEQTQAGVKTLPINDLTSLEGIKYHSVRCNTPGHERRLNFIPYDMYRENDGSDLSNIPTGAPRSWTYFDSPDSDGATATTREMVISPTPDDVYEIEYSAKISHQPLTRHDDKIIWPVEYEHVLVSWGRAAIESKLGTADLSSYAQAALDNVRQWATGPADEPIKASFGGASVGLECNWNIGTTGYEWGDYY